MPDESEMIREKIRDTQCALEEKLDILENRVAHTIDEGTSAVRQGVDKLKAAYHLVSEVRHHPWLLLGGLLAIAYGGFRLLGTEHGTGREKPLSGWLTHLAGVYAREASPLVLDATLALARQALGPRSRRAALTREEGDSAASEWKGTRFVPPLP